MARRRIDNPATVEHRVQATEIPEHLATWYFEDWVEPDELPAEPWLRHDTGAVLSGGDLEPSARWFARAMLSRNRFRAAQRAWADDLRRRSITPPPLPNPGRPRFRRSFHV